MIFSDEIVQEMAKIVKAQETDPVFNPDMAHLKIDMSQFSLSAPTTEEHVNLASIPLIQNVVIAAADDKKILKEKKRALEVGDIVEQAHPEQAVLADGTYGTGVVEDLNEQHAKLVNMVYRNPVGFNFNSFASIANALVKLADKLEAKGDLKGVSKVDAILQEMFAKKADQKNMPGGDPEVLPPEEGTGLPPKKKQMPVTLDGELGDKKNSAPSLSDAADVMKSFRGDPQGLPPGATPPNTSMVHSPGGELAVHQPGSMSPHSSIPGAEKATKEVAQLVESPVAAQGESFLAKMLGKAKGLRGGKWALVGAALAASMGGIYALYQASKSDWTNAMEIAKEEAGGYYNKTVLQLVMSLDKNYNDFEQAIKDGRADPQDMLIMQNVLSDANHLAAIGFNVSPKMTDASKKLQSLAIDLDKKTGDMVAQQTDADSKSVSENEDTPGKKDPVEERRRLADMKHFFNKEFQDHMADDESSDEHLRNRLVNFAEGMKKEFPPEFAMNAPNLNGKALFEKGTYDMLANLYRAWRYPKMVVDELDRKKSN